MNLTCCLQTMILIFFSNDWLYVKQTITSYKCKMHFLRRQINTIIDEVGATKYELLSYHVVTEKKTNHKLTYMNLKKYRKYFFFFKISFISLIHEDKSYLDVCELKILIFFFCKTYKTYKWL